MLAKGTEPQEAALRPAHSLPSGIVSECLTGQEGLPRVGSGKEEVRVCGLETTRKELGLLCYGWGLGEPWLFLSFLPHTQRRERGEIPSGCSKSKCEQLRG